MPYTPPRNQTAMSGLKSIDASSLVKTEPNPDLAEIHPGDTVKVHYRVIEGARERIQVFQGTVIKIRSGGVDANFTVRRVAHAVGVERTFLFNSPRLQKLEVVKLGRVRRARLYYLRGLSGKAARIKEKRFS